MSRQEILQRAPFFHQLAGWNPENFTYRIEVTPSGYKAVASDNRSEIEYAVVFYNHKSGRLIGANEKQY